MALAPYKVDFYQDKSGKRPIETFLEALPDKEVDAILRTVCLLATTGPHLNQPHCKKLRGTDLIWELRVRQGRRHFRLLYAPITESNYLLLHIFQKRSETLRPEDIDIACRRLQEISVA